jgi:hypothetical protein
VRLLRPVRLLPALIACALFLTACGKGQEPPRRVFEVKAPKGQKHADFSDEGMEFDRPGNWRLRPSSHPAVFELTSGQATIAGWAYPREEDLPESDEQLEAAKGRLLDAIEDRDSDFQVASAETTDVAGAPAIEVRGEQVISKRRLATRSVHVFENGTEYVIEALEPPADRNLVETRVLEPLLDSLVVEGIPREDGE